MSATDHPTVDLMTLTPRERECYDVGRLFGYIEGHEAGARWADDHAAALHYEAVRVVRRLAGMPEVDREAARRRALERARRWSA